MASSTQGPGGQGRERTDLPHREAEGRASGGAQCGGDRAGFRRPLEHQAGGSLVGVKLKIQK